MKFRKKIGYIRTNPIDQNLKNQLKGLDLDKIFLDQTSGKSINRPQLEAMIAYAKKGDIVFVDSLDRLAWNLDDLVNIVFQLNNKQVSIQFIKENIIFTDENPFLSKLMISMMEAFKGFERAVSKERQLEGIALAKKKKLYKGRKPSLNEAKIEELTQLIKRGEKKNAIAKHLGISRETLYRYLRSEVIIRH